MYCYWGEVGGTYNMHSRRKVWMCTELWLGNLSKRDHLAYLYCDSWNGPGGIPVPSFCGDSDEPLVSIRTGNILIGWMSISCLPWKIWLHLMEWCDYRWLKQQFQEADVDKNGSLNYEECLVLLKQLNVKLPGHTVKRMFDVSQGQEH
jgi:hypothetical protein